MKRVYEVVEYNREDLLKLDNMSFGEIRQAIDDLDRGYFNQTLFPEYDNEFTTYSESDYNTYRLVVALRKVDNILRKLENGDERINLGNI